MRRQAVIDIHSGNNQPLGVGKGCDISSGAQIYTHSTAKRCVSGRRYAEIDRAPTRLGDEVFVGANATIQMGVTVGDRAVIGAGAVVVSDVPSEAIVAGVPAVVIGRVMIDGDSVVFDYT